MKRMFLAALLACSMLAALPVRAAQVDWRKMADNINSDPYSWSVPGYWSEGAPPNTGDDVGFQLTHISGNPTASYPTTVIYDVSNNIVFNEILISDQSNHAPLILSLGTGYTLSATTVMLGVSNTDNKQGSLVLSGGALESDYVSISLSGNILQLAGTNTVHKNLINQGTYQLSGGTLTVESTLFVGEGTFTQDGGYNYTNLLSVGSWDVGTYSLGGLGSLVATTERVGNTSTGTFYQTGGAHEVTGTLSIGVEANGRYDLSGGTLDAGILKIGHNALGVFNQSGGNNTLGSIVIGTAGSSNGQLNSAYYFSGGMLVADSITVGDSGNGDFGHTGGTSQVDVLSLGWDSGASGTYTLNGSGSIGFTSLTAGVEHIGYSGTGVFNQLSNIDGVHTVGELYLGYNAGANGSYNMSGHALLAAGDVVVGRAGNGTFTQNRGTSLIGAVAIGGVPTGTGTLTIGDLLGGTGVYSMNPIDSALPELSASTEVIGNYGNGTFMQFGGTNTVGTPGSGNPENGNLYLGRYDTGVGNYTLSGFPDTYFNPFGPSPPPTVLLAANEYIGSGGTGTFNQTGGTNRLSGDLHVGGSGTGTYDLSGGTLYTANIWIGAGTGTGMFIQRGGTNNVSNVLRVGANGTYTLSGIEGPGSPASLITGGILNNGTFNYSGGFLSIFRPPIGPPPYPPDPDFTNNGTLNISGTGERYFSSPVINNGTVKTTNTTVIFNGNFINNGAYISDPSTNIFSNLTVGSTGYLAGALGDVFRINGNMFVRSLRDEQWNTTLATLEFSSGIHTLDVSRSTVDIHFGTLQIDSGGYFSDSSNGTIFADVLNIHGLSAFLGNFHGSFLRINYGSLFAFDFDGEGNPYLVNGDQLNFLASLGFTQTPVGQAPVPEPSTMLLLGSGLAGLAGYGRRRISKR